MIYMVCSKKNPRVLICSIYIYFVLNDLLHMYSFLLPKAFNFLYVYIIFLSNIFLVEIIEEKIRSYRGSNLSYDLI